VANFQRPKNRIRTCDSQSGKLNEVLLGIFLFFIDINIQILKHKNDFSCSIKQLLYFVFPLCIHVLKLPVCFRSSLVNEKKQGLDAWGRSEEFNSRGFENINRNDLIPYSAIEKSHYFYDWSIF